MSMKPITIEIKDNWVFGEVAFLVDRDNFLKDVGKVRKELGIAKLMTLSEMINWLRKERKELDEGLLSRRQSYAIANELRKKHRRSPTFFHPIMSAIFCGVVTEDDFPSIPFCRLIYPKMLPIDVYTLSGGFEPRIAIIISPETKLDEVIQVFRTEVPKVVEKYKKDVLKSKRPPLDTISNIRRDRGWYWLKKKGLSYEDIRKRAVSGGEHISRDGVIKAIKQYRERLAMEL